MPTKNDVYIKRSCHKGKLRFIGYIDVRVKNKVSGRVKVIDIKTSTRGWRDYEKKNKNKKMI